MVEIGQGKAIVGGRHFVRKKAKVFSAAQSRLRHVADRLTGIAALHKSDFIRPRDNSVSNRVEDFSTIHRRGGPPRGKRRYGGLRRGVDVGGTGRGYGRLDLICRWVESPKGIAGN